MIHGQINKVGEDLNLVCLVSGSYGEYSLHLHTHMPSRCNFNSIIIVIRITGIFTVKNNNIHLLVILKVLLVFFFFMETVCWQDCDAIQMFAFPCMQLNILQLIQQSRLFSAFVLSCFVVVVRAIISFYINEAWERGKRCPLSAGTLCSPHFTSAHANCP